MKKGKKQLLDAPSQQGVSIEIGSIPTAPENAPSQEHTLGDERRQLDGTNTESILFEPPPFTQGEVPTLSSKLTSLISQISSEYNLEHPVHTSLDVPKSSDTVLDAMITTQNPQSVGEGVHAAAHPDDTN